jgi:hypothetical protein
MLPARLFAALAAFASATPCPAPGAHAELVLKPAKERGTSPEKLPTAGSTTKEQRLALCLGSWDAQTHMTKREWRTACTRTVKDYPDTFRW